MSNTNGTRSFRLNTIEIDRRNVIEAVRRATEATRANRTTQNRRVGWRVTGFTVSTRFYRFSKRTRVFYNTDVDTEPNSNWSRPDAATTRRHEREYPPNAKP